MTYKNPNPSSTPYGSNKGEIASPNTDSIVNNLKRSTGNSFPVNHNQHADIGRDGRSKSVIESPATDGIVDSNFGRGFNVDNL